jgi:hypothetical protein
VVAGVVVLLASSGGSLRRPSSPGVTHPGKPSPPPTPAPPGPGPPAQPAPIGEQFGASVNRLFNDGTYAPAQISAQLEALRQTGATVARSDAFWEASEQQPPVQGVHRYDWRFDDTVAGSLAAHGLRWLPIIDYSARWAESVPGEDHSAPSSPDGYAAYAGAFAARYGPGGAFWRAHPRLTPEPVETFEIWNEPDSPQFWKPAPSAARYAQLYTLARDAITAVDRSARVIVGGLTHPEVTLPAMLAASPALSGHIDGVAIHPYGATPAVVLGRVSTARATLRALGMASVPLYATEFGWTTRYPGALDYVPQRLRPGYIFETISALGHVNCGVPAAVLYTWVTPERDPQVSEDWFGIHPPAGGSSPDAGAFMAALRRAARPAATIDACAG